MSISKQTFKNNLRLFLLLIGFTLTSTLFSQEIRVNNKKGTIQTVNKNLVTTSLTFSTNSIAGDSLIRITGSLNSFDSNDFTVNILYVLSTLGTPAQISEILNKGLTVLYTANR